MIHEYSHIQTPSGDYKLETQLTSVHLYTERRAEEVNGHQLKLLIRYGHSFDVQNVSCYFLKLHVLLLVYK